MDFLEIDLLGPQPIFSETVQHVEKLKDKYNLKYLNDFCFFADFIKVFGFLILTN
jgi:predicted nucleic acid-binding protein